MPIEPDNDCLHSNEISQKERAEYLELIGTMNQLVEQISKMPEEDQLKVQGIVKHFQERTAKDSRERKHGYRSLQEIADGMNITRERVRQIEKVALYKARRTWLQKFPNN